VTGSTGVARRGKTGRGSESVVPQRAFGGDDADVTARRFGTSARTRCVGDLLGGFLEGSAVCVASAVIAAAARGGGDLSSSTISRGAASAAALVLGGEHGSVSVSSDESELDDEDDDVEDELLLEVADGT
jgi:hypothetical protein